MAALNRAINAGSTSCGAQGAGNGDMVRTEVLALGESRRQQLLPLSLSTEPAPDPTTWARVRAYFVVRRATSSFRWINDAKVKISSASCSAMSHSILRIVGCGVSYRSE